MEVTIRHLGSVEFEAIARGHRAVCDQPADNGGTDHGMTPPEMFLAALGSCAGHYAAEYLKARNLSSAGLEVRVEAEKIKPPARLGRIRIAATVPGLGAEHEAGVLRAVKACLLHNTLMHAPEVEMTVHAAAEVPVS